MKPQCTLMKKSALPPKKALAPGAPKLKATGTNFVFVDNQDDTITVMAADASGAPVALDGLATLSVTSSDPTKVTVDTPTGMTVLMHGIAPTTTGTPPVDTPVLIHIVATANDGSFGPLSFDQPVSVKTGPATGLVITLGTPVSR